MLILEKCIGKGATRECYRHPADASKCVKVLIKNTDTSILKRELKYYKSYENNKSWTFLKLEKIFTPLAERIMIRRLKRLYKMLGIEWFQTLNNNSNF